MRHWQKGDKVGQGLALFRGNKERREYGAECKRQILEAAARQAVKLRTIEARRSFIKSFPPQLQEELKAQITALWNK